MLNKSIIVLLALVMMAIVGVGIYAGSAPVKPTSQSNTNDIITVTTEDTPKISNTQSNPEKTMISASEAQSIAQTYIEEPGATAGTPHLVEIDGQMIYVVPVIMDDKTVGQIEIDAYTGKNVGGAGGVA